MTRARDEIERDIQALSDEQRLVLPRSLIADLDGSADTDIEQAWLADAKAAGSPKSTSYAGATA